jgi:four helix bundle protein
MYTSFTQMPVWRTAHELSLEIFQITFALPKYEDYGLTSQIRRSANSVSANIAEGYGRQTSKDKTHFYIIAKGSAYETQNHLCYGHKVGYFKKEIVVDLFNKYEDLIKSINKLNKSLR